MSIYILDERLESNQLLHCSSYSEWIERFENTESVSEMLGLIHDGLDYLLDLKDEQISEQILLYLKLSDEAGYDPSIIDTWWNDPKSRIMMLSWKVLCKQVFGKDAYQRHGTRRNFSNIFYGICEPQILDEFLEYFVDFETLSVTANFPTRRVIAKHKHSRELAEHFLNDCVGFIFSQIKRGSYLLNKFENPDRVYERFMIWATIVGIHLGYDEILPDDVVIKTLECIALSCKVRIPRKNQLGSPSYDSKVPENLDEVIAFGSNMHGSFQRRCAEICLSLKIKKKLREETALAQ